MLEIIYTNKHGEIMRLRQDETTKKIMINHSDIHTENIYEDIIFCFKNYIFNHDEYQVIGTYAELCTSLL